jgi:hypothetical protein
VRIYPGYTHPIEVAFGNLWLLELFILLYPFYLAFFALAFSIWGWDSGIEWIGLWETALQGSGPGECVSLLLWLSEGEIQTEEEVEEYRCQSSNKRSSFFYLTSISVSVCQQFIISLN